MELKALQESADKNKYLYNKINPELLEKFEKPNPKYGSLKLHIEVPEFTCLCPMTGQPDFAKIIIDYVPNLWCVESKSLKLYLMGYRNTGMFHEECVTTILNDLVVLLEPEYLEVKGEFAPRGGIPFHPTASYINSFYKDQTQDMVKNVS